ncbi:hypothetical protein HYPSUDRAFT_75617 [Hypholoma sublateritium FD-334 SS-4]|uniref:Uncharacterized protein n=1 Tax=Hypholoma sublateritium (strain FD-334 SS-4) TaxID=945553 RepID=A0A0D2PBJ7_HYPSF|nr:hypothetical protein HYPSUDRAFT_75617 [Hypholoma sublateritium FD-334 SS-4]
MPAATSSKVALALLLSLALAVPVHSVPTPQAEVGNAYSGAGGHASGGGVSSGSSTSAGPLGGLELLDVFSHNAGAGGKANSGPAFAGKVNTTNTDDKQGNAYSGAGGTADGGSVSGGVPALVSLFSGNAGKGGSASSGIAAAGVDNLGQLGAPAEKGRKFRLARMIRVRRDFVLPEEEEMA